jgi:hypothetical protein
VSFIFDFEDSVTRYGLELGVDGVICGHIHAATIKQIEGITYINCGDWVDSCTAILEHDDGRMELIEWGARRLEAEAAQVRYLERPAEPVLPEAASTPATARKTKLSITPEFLDKEELAALASLFNQNRLCAQRTRCHRSPTANCRVGLASGSAGLGKGRFGLTRPTMGPIIALCLAIPSNAPF